MQTLLRIEWLKIKNYRAFKILSIFFAAGVILANYAVHLFNKNVINNVNTGGLVSSFDPYSFYNTWKTTSYTSGFLLILPAMLLMILITNEYSFRTSRQNVIDGWSRNEFISVKIVMAFIIALFSTVLVFLTAATMGLFSGTEFSANGISHLMYFFLKAASYNMIALLIAVLIKKTGFAIGLYFIYLGFENFVSQIFDILSMKLKMDGGPDIGGAGDYLPMNASDGLLTFPDNPLKAIAKSTMPTDYYWLVLTLAVLYLIVFVLWSRRKFIKSDL